jgi:phenylalanyl-tRNA synthetase beta chain
MPARYGRKTVVCGAPNCRPGLLTAYVPLGKKVIDGVESDGMLASAAELGINRDHAGIIELGTLAGPAARPTASSRSTTSPSRTGPTCGATTAWRAKWPPSSGGSSDPVRSICCPQGPAAVKIQIEDLDLCPRYSALVFENVTVQPSPLWLQYRLTAIGLNPINNIVDMTNFVMAELAQPMHAFDADLLHGDTIFIRPAKPGERLPRAQRRRVHAGCHRTW